MCGVRLAADAACVGEGACGPRGMAWLGLTQGLGPRVVHACASSGVGVGVHPLGSSALAHVVWPSRPRFLGNGCASKALCTVHTRDESKGLARGAVHGTVVHLQGSKRCLHQPQFIIPCRQGAAELGKQPQLAHTQRVARTMITP